MFHKKLYYGGQIITCNPRDEVAEAMVTEEDRILYVGDYREARFLMDADTEVCRMDGGAILPGFFADGLHLSAESGQTGGLEGLLAGGVTSVFAMGDEDAAALRGLQGRLRGAEPLPRVTVDLFVPEEGGSPQAEALTAAGICTGFGDDGLRMGVVRLPVPEERAADPSYALQLTVRLRRYAEAGLCVELLPAGNRAVAVALSAYVGAQPKRTGKDRIRLRHDHPDSILDGIAAAGLSVCVCAADLSEEGLFPPPRIRSLCARGIPVIISPEGLPAGLSAPLSVLATAVEGRGFSPATRAAQTPTVLQALRGMTLAWAAACGRAEEIGSLEWGKKADIVFLSASPLSLSPDRIRRLRVRTTVLDGKTVYKEPTAADAPTPLPLAL